MSEEQRIDVDAILSTKQNQYKPIEVDKDVEVDLDIGNLLATDTNILQSDELRSVNKKFICMSINLFMHPSTVSPRSQVDGQLSEVIYNVISYYSTKHITDKQYQELHIFECVV